MLNSSPQIQARQILDIVYPIGIIQQFYDDTDPNNIMYGQTWVKLENVFLYGSGKKSIGTTGGEESHTLSVNEMPSHTHTQNPHNHAVWSTNANHSKQYWSNNAVAINNPSCKSIGGCELNQTIADNSVRITAQGYDIIKRDTATNQHTGGNMSHNNMPPYRVVGIWRRTA